MGIWQNHKGFILINACNLCFAFNDLFVKLSSHEPQPLGGTEVFLFRGILQVLVGGMGCVVLGVSALEGWGVKRKLALRGFLGAMANLLLYNAIARITMSDAMAIFWVQPVWSIIFSPFLGHGRASRVEILIALICILGVVLVSRPDFIFGDEHDQSINTEKIAGIIFALVAAGFNSLVPYSVKNLPEDVHNFAMIFSFGVNGCVAALIARYAIDQHPAPWPEGSVLVYGIALSAASCALLGQILQDVGFRHERPVRASIIMTGQVFLVLLLQMIFLDHQLFWSSWAGTLLILGGAVWLVLSKFEKNMKKSSKV